MNRTFRVHITRTDRAELPSGAAIGFGYLLQAKDHQEAEIDAMARLARSHDSHRLFVESIQDVTF